MRRFDLVFLLLTWLLTSCGLQKSKYTDYEGNAQSQTASGEEAASETEGTSGSTATDTASSCPTALAAFVEQISRPLEVCSACHLSTAIGGSVLKSNDDAYNRSVLLHYDQSEDGSTLYSKITGSHGGGNQSSVLSQEALALWKAAESGC
ncbi:MAG: hypothetical protein H6618_01130 [Deltaproteobacteria bacterium]|nr:hypothetical protein [Deltaproteobacteria bacterium]